MHNKPTHPFTYHASPQTWERLQAMSKANSRSVTMEITAAIDAAWQKYCQEINQTLPVESENENAS